MTKDARQGVFIPLVKLAVFTFLVPGSVTAWVPYYFYRSSLRRDFVGANLPTVVAFLSIALGMAGYLWCALDFTFRGKGTPAPIDPPKVLVVRGLYRYVRNPMYISVLLILLGECLLFRSGALLRYIGYCFLFVFLFVLFYEEPALRHKFGASYEQYCKDVPRWIPRFR